MIKLYIVDGFENCNKEWINTTLYDDKGNAIISGDTFHDNISDCIKGFIEAFNYLGVDFKIYNAQLKGEE